MSHYIQLRMVLKASITMKSMWKFAKEFCDHSTIHGVRYITERRRHWTERVWWVIAFVVSSFFCGVSIEAIWRVWHENPIKISFTEADMCISEIPFPTVTICPKTKTTKKKLDLFETVLTNSSLTDLQRLRLNAVSHLCSSIISHESQIELNDQFASESIYDTIIDVAPPFDGTVRFCIWQSDFIPCSELLVPLLTKDGLCFAFNALNSREIYTEQMAPGMKIVKSRSNMTRYTFEDGYEGGYRKDEYPVRTFNSEYRSGLVIDLTLLAEDLEYLCHYASLGFEVTLTQPVETTEMAINVFEVPLSENTLISMKPQITTTSENLRKYKPIDRQCFFSNERKLRFFNVYTQNNCEAECLANFTQSICDCVKFSMPRDEDSKICGSSRIQCYAWAENKLFEEESGIQSEKAASSFKTKCNCLPSCTSINYNAHTDHLKFDLDILAKVQHVKKIASIHPARLAIFFRDHGVEKQQRMETTTYTDFLAVCGGLLGLFLGVSVLSIVEFIYFFTLRLFCNIRRSKTENTVAPFKRTDVATVTIDMHSD